jgi:hypothetical protein
MVSLQGLVLEEFERRFLMALSSDAGDPEGITRRTQERAKWRESGHGISWN